MGDNLADKLLIIGNDQSDSQIYLAEKYSRNVTTMPKRGIYTSRVDDINKIYPLHEPVRFASIVWDRMAMLGSLCTMCLDSSTYDTYIEHVIKAV